MCIRHVREVLLRSHAQVQTARRGARDEVRNHRLERVLVRDVVLGMKRATRLGELLGELPERLIGETLRQADGAAASLRRRGHRGRDQERSHDGKDQVMSIPDGCADHDQPTAYCDFWSCATTDRARAAVKGTRPVRPAATSSKPRTRRGSSATTGRMIGVSSATCAAKRSGLKIVPLNSRMRARYALRNAGTAYMRARKRMLSDQGL